MKESFENSLYKPFLPLITGCFALCSASNCHSRNGNDVALLLQLIFCRPKSQHFGPVGSSRG